MKIVSLLLMIGGILLLVVFGFMYLLGFAMSFDAPGSTSDPQAWMMRLLMLLPLFALLMALILSFVAYNKGNYNRSVIIMAAMAGVFILLFVILMISSFRSVAKFNEHLGQQMADANLYPVQKFIRKVEGGADTILVFPNGIVAYRLYQGTNIPWAGPLGDLSESRDTVYYHVSTDTKIAISELDQFVDEQGHKFSELYTTIVARK